MLQAAIKADPDGVTADRAVIVCHSTGGLIVRSALGDDAFSKRVERVVFMNVPFWGAPKAYDVYLTGDMGIPFLDSDVLQTMVPNLPVFYYLAPSRRYPAAVLSDIRDDGKRVEFTRSALSAGRVMEQLLARSGELGTYPSGVDPWSAKLEEAAERFHAGLLPSKELLKRVPCRVFWSTNRDTVGTLGLRPRRGIRRIEIETTRGDGTVPEVSQKADWPANVCWRLESDAEHVSAVTDAEAWKEIIRWVHDPDRKED